MSINDPRADLLRKHIAQLEADANTVENGEDPGTGLTIEEHNRLLQYRFELEQIEGGSHEPGPRDA